MIERKVSAFETKSKEFARKNMGKFIIEKDGTKTELKDLETITQIPSKGLASYTFQFVGDLESKYLPESEVNGSEIKHSHFQLVVIYYDPENGIKNELREYVFDRYLN